MDKAKTHPIELSAIRIVGAPKARKPSVKEAGAIPASVADPLFTSKEAREYLKVSKPTIHRWVGSGILKPNRLPGGGLRFRKSALDGILA